MGKYLSEGGYVLNVEMPDKKLTALLPTNNATTLETDAMTTTGAIKCRFEQSGRDTQIVAVQEQR